MWTLTKGLVVRDVKGWFDVLLKTVDIPGAALVIVDEPVSGKSRFVEEVAERVGEHKVLRPSHVGVFLSGDLLGKRLIICEEHMLRRREDIKPFITETDLVGEKKGKYREISDNRTCFIFTATKFHPTVDDRRFIVTDLEKARYAFSLTTTGA